MFGDYGEGGVRRLLAVGFILVILLLVTDGMIGFHSIRSIRTAASELAEDQFTQMALVDEVQREQGPLSAIFYRLDGDPDSLDRGSIVAQIETTGQDIARIVARVPADSPDIDTWNHLAAASSSFSEEARRLVLLDHPPTLQSPLLRRPRSNSSPPSAVSSAPPTTALAPPRTTSRSSPPGSCKRTPSSSAAACCSPSSAPSSSSAAPPSCIRR